MQDSSKNTNGVQEQLNRDCLIRAFKDTKNNFLDLSREFAVMRQMYIDDPHFRKYRARIEFKLNEDERSLNILVRSLTLLIDDVAKLTDPLQKEQYQDIGRRFTAIRKASETYSKVAAKFTQELCEMSNEILEQYHDVDDDFDSTTEDEWNDDYVEDDDEDDRRR